MNYIKTSVFSIFMMLMGSQLSFAQTSETETDSIQVNEEEVVAYVMTPEDQIKFVGKYEIQPDFVVVISQKDDKLMAYAPDYGKMEMVADDAMNFHIKSMPTSVKFKDDENGKITMMVIDHEGQIIPASRIE